MHNIKSSNVLFPVDDDTRSAHVTSTSNHDNVASVELDEVNDFALLKVKLYGVIDLDEGIWVTDCSSIVGDDMRDTLGAYSDPSDLEKLVGGLPGGDTVNSEATLDVVEETEMLPGFLNGNDIWKNGSREARRKT